MENNFKDLKDNITKGVFETVINGSKNKNFKKFIAEIKKSPILKEQIEVYNLVENVKFDTKEEAMFAFERAMRVFEKYTDKEVETANKNLVESFGGVFNKEDEIYNVIELYTTHQKKIDYKPKTQIVKNLVENMVAKPILKEEVVEDPVIKLPTKKILKRAIAILNEKYSFLDNKEKRIFKSFIENNAEEKEFIYNELLSENLNLVKRKLFESEDEQLDEKLIMIESKLKEDNFSQDKQIEDYVKLLELNKTLS